MITKSKQSAQLMSDAIDKQKDTIKDLETKLSESVGKITASADELASFKAKCKAIFVNYIPKKNDAID